MAVGIVVAVVVLLAIDYAAGPSCAPPVPKLWQTGSTTVLVPCGTHVTLPADSYVGYSAGRFSDAEILLGKFQSSAPIGAYLLNSSQFDSLNSNPHPTGPPGQPFWTCGVVASCQLNADVPPSPSEYFLALENFNSTNASVVWSQSLTVAWISVNNS